METSTSELEKNEHFITGIELHKPFDTGELQHLNDDYSKILLKRIYQSDAIYRATLNASPDVIVVSDLEGKITMLSPKAAQEIYNTDNVETFIGRSIFEFIHPDDHPRLMSNYDLMFKKYIGNVEYNIFRSDGTTFPAEVNGDIIKDADDNPLGLVFIVRDISERKASEQKIKHSKQQIKEFAEHLQQIREEEKVALAREIHDDLGQVLVALKIDLGMFKKKITGCIPEADFENIAADIDKHIELTNKSISITRRIMTDLRSETIDKLGLIGALRTHVQNFEDRYKIKSIFKVSHKKHKFTQNQTVAIYRILQEALNNIAKHANATKVKVELIKSDRNYCFKIADNGCGFDIDKSGRLDSYGMMGMRERVALINGELSIQSKVGKGTSIIITLPTG